MMPFVVRRRDLMRLVSLAIAGSFTLGGATLADSQRRQTGDATVYLNFAINCHDWVHPDLSSETVLRAARYLAKHGLKADFYATGPLYRAWTEKAPGTIEELVRLGMGLGYHQRPPHPIFFNHEQRRRILAMEPAEAYETFVRFESEQLDLATGDTVAGQPGGFLGAKQRAGLTPIVLGAGSAPPRLMALNRQVLRTMGARMLVAHHSR
ncbi:MAG: hypothetical protein GY953_24725, partial [bacterium]|nr:hypothetical protein [bacterium]